MKDHDFPQFSTPRKFAGGISISSFDFFEWTLAPQMQEAEFSFMMLDGGWTTYTPANPATFQLVVSETSNPDGFDAFRVGQVLSVPPPGAPDYFDVVGTELFFDGTKIADLSVGPASLTVNFLALPGVTEYGTLAGYVAANIEYRNTTAMESGDTLAQTLQIDFYDNGVLVSSDLQVATIHGVSPVGADIHGTPRPDVLQGTNLNERIFAYTAGDEVYGLEGDDTIYGAQGRDHLDGGAGNDVIEGANGKDTIVGGAGNDVMTGGRGDDVFVFGNTSAGGADRILDFRVCHDTLQLIDGISVAAVFAGGDSVVTLSNGATITLAGVTVTSVAELLA